MRKYFLLILYIAGLVFTQQGLNAKLPSVAFKVRGGSVIPLTVKTVYNSCSYYSCNESNFDQSGFNLEDDENAKSKLVHIAGPSLLQTDIRFIAETNPLKYRSSFRPVFSFGLFKLNRVLRL